MADGYTSLTGLIIKSGLEWNFCEINEKYAQFASYLLFLLLFQEANIAKYTNSSEIKIILFEICIGNPSEFFLWIFLEHQIHDRNVHEPSSTG